MADLAGVPGAGRIMEIAHQLVAEPGALTAAGTRWSKAGKEATSMGDVLASKSAALDGAWDGVGADAMVGYAAQLRTALDAIAPAAKEITGALEQAEQALTTARTAVEAITDRVHAAVAALAPSLGDSAGTLEREQAIAAIVGPAVGEAENALNATVNALRGATGQITAACGARPVTSLPPISEQPFEPARFTPHAWWIHPVPQPGEPTDTTAQGASSPRDFGALGGGPLGSGPSGSGASGGGSARDGAAGGFAGSPGGAGSLAVDVGGGRPASGGPPAGGGRAAPAQVQQWIDQAIEVLRAQGVPVDTMSRDDIWAIIEHESGGDPHAINNWDSNAAKGTPSKGLMQCIDPTFASHALPGHGDIWNPVDNIIAGVRYSISRYGSVSNVPGIAAMRGGGGYVGY